MPNMNEVLSHKVGVNQVFKDKAKQGDTPRVRVQDVVNYKDAGLSVEEARKRMLEAGEAPKGIATEKRKNDATGAVIPKPAEPVQETPAPPVEPKAVEQPKPADTVTIVQPQPAERGTGGSQPTVEAVDNKVERIETDRFLAEIKQERGEWVAAITFKNGAGTEKFSARTKNELLLKLVEGKANATLRVRAAVRREKLGTAPYDQKYVLPENVSIDDFNAMSENVQKAFVQNLEVAAGTLFVHNHPTFYQSAKNTEDLLAFLSSRNLPVTYNNLSLAFEDLTEDGLLEVAPVEPPKTNLVETPALPAAPKTEDSVPVVAPTPPAPAVVAAPAQAEVVVRTRGTSGLRPGDSSAVNEELEPPKDAQPTGPSATELRKSVPIGQPVRGSTLEAEYKKLMAEKAKNRQRF